MSFALTLSEFDKKERFCLLKRFTSQAKPTQYEPDPTKHYCFRADTKEDLLHLPLGSWKEYVDPRDGFPNGEAEDFPRMNKKAKFAGALYTKKTDPKKRDQDVIAAKALERLELEGSVFISCYTGLGKCLAPGTKVLMFDGTKKNVEDVVSGELLMGDDSTFRTVLSTCEGEEEMFEIIPNKGESFTVNKSHILTLKASGQGRIQYHASRDRYIVRWFDGSALRCTSKSFKSETEAKLRSESVSQNVFDIEITDYLEIHTQGKHILKSFWASADYPAQDVPVEPRWLGIWLGDGTSKSTTVTTVDDEVGDYITNFAKRENLSVSHVVPANRAPYYSIRGRTGSGLSHTNHLLTRMRELNVMNNKHIPLVYKANSRKVRLELLAGLIDTDGYYNPEISYEIVQKRKTLAYDIQDICRSLGFACFVETRKYCTYKGEKREGTYWLVSFYGKGLEDIPVLMERKRAKSRNHNKDALVVGFRVVPRGVGKYYGFAIDGNRRFMLGSHMVTHNTGIAIYLSLALGLKTMIICHFTIVREQWPDEYKKFCGTNIKIQFLKGKGCKLDPSADVYIVGIQKAAMMTEDDFVTIGTVVIDEAHIATVAAFTKALLLFRPRYLIGLSATPDRPDGLHSLLTNYFGPMNEFIVRKEKKNFTVYKVQTPFKPEMSYTVVRGRTVPNWSAIINSIEEDEKRWKWIADIVQSHPEEKIIILCNRNALANGVFELLESRGEPGGCEKLIGNKKKWDKTKRVLVAGMKKGGVGLNDPSLTMAIIASDTKDVRQYEGRIRTTNNIIYHLVDYYKPFQNHWEVCEGWYIEKGAVVEVIGIEHHFKQTTSKTEVQRAKARGQTAGPRFLSRKT